MDIDDLKEAKDNAMDEHGVNEIVRREIRKKESKD